MKKINYGKALREDGIHKIFDIVPMWYWREWAIDITRELGLWENHFDLRLDSVKGIFADYTRER